MSESTLIRKHFSWEDYAVFVAMLFVLTVIGIYYGFVKKKINKEDKNATEFLIGGGNMSTFPVALSLLLGFVSSITLMAQPAEVYQYGPQIWLFGVGSFVITPVVNYLVIPFFRNLNVTSVYQYFGTRFSRPVQLFGSFLFSLQIVIQLAMVMYAPSLALHQVTGMNTSMIVIIMFLVCIFYTTVGGIRAVVLTDAFQAVVLYVAMIVVLLQGTWNIGGFGVVFQRSAEHQRADFFNFDPDLTVRYSAWGTLLGGGCVHLALFCGNQFQIQRFSSVPNNKEARKLVWIYAVGWSVATMLTAYAGMLIFATYYDCDPLSSGIISSADHIFPFFVMDVLAGYKGTPGLFVAGLFSASLSTVSSGINSLAAIWFAELDGTKFKESFTAKKAEITVKLLALGFGLLSFAVVFLVPFMGPLVQLSMTLNGYVPGSLAGVFALGIYVPFANSWGAFIGLISSICIVTWLTVGAQLATRNGYTVHPVLPLSTEGCPANVTSITSAVHPPAPAIFRLSFMWYSMIAFALTVVIGVMVSLLIRSVKSYFYAKIKRKRPEVRRESNIVRGTLLLEQQRALTCTS